VSTVASERFGPVNPVTIVSPSVRSRLRSAFPEGATVTCRAITSVMHVDGEWFTFHRGQLVAGDHPAVLKNPDSFTLAVGDSPADVAAITARMELDEELAARNARIEELRELEIRRERIAQLRELEIRRNRISELRGGSSKPPAGRLTAPRPPRRPPSATARTSAKAYPWTVVLRERAEPNYEIHLAGDTRARS
jgi:hypothetical protein